MDVPLVYSRNGQGFIYTIIEFFTTRLTEGWMIERLDPSSNQLSKLDVDEEELEELLENSQMVDSQIPE